MTDLQKQTNINIISPYIFGRMAVFIDEANLFHSQKTLKWQVDFKKLYWYLFDEYAQNLNIYIYVSYVKSNTKQLAFIDKLVEYNYIVHTKEVKEIRQKNSAEKIRKGNLDVEIALDIYRFMDMYDTMILFSGDSDFVYLIELLKKSNKKIVIVSNKGHISKELLQRGKYIDLKKLKSSIEFSRKSLKPLESGLSGTTPQF